MRARGSSERGAASLWLEGPCIADSSACTLGRGYWGQSKTDQCVINKQQPATRAHWRTTMTFPLTRPKCRGQRMRCWGPPFRTSACSPTIPPKV